MSEWKEYKLGEIASFKTGKLNSNAAIENGVYPFFTCSPITLSIDKYAYDQKAILLAGNNAEGNFCIKYYEGKFNAYQRTYIIESQEDVCNLKFLYYSLKLCLQEFKNISQGTSTRFLTAVILNNFEIHLPPLNEQKRIASILSSLDDKIDLLNRENATLEAMAETLFRQWFIEEAKEDWEEKPLSSIATFLNGLACQKYPPKNEIEKLPVLKIRELTNGIGTDSDWATTDVGKEYIIHSGDVIFAWSASLMVKIWDGEDCILNQHLFKVTSTTHPKWFYYLWCKYHLNEFIAIAQSHATTMGHIKRNDLDTAMVLVPSDGEILTMNDIMETLFSKIVNNNQQLISLQTNRDILLPKLMSNEVQL